MGWGGAPIRFLASRTGRWRVWAQCAVDAALGTTTAGDSARLVRPACRPAMCLPVARTTTSRASCGTTRTRCCRRRCRTRACGEWQLDGASCVAGAVMESKASKGWAVAVGRLPRVAPSCGLPAPRTAQATCPTPWLPLMPAPHFVNRRHTQLGLPALLHAHGGPARGHPAHDHPQELRWVGWGWGAPGPGLTAPAGWHAPRPRQCSELRLSPHPAPLCSEPPPSPSPPPQAAPTSSSAATWRAASPA